MQTASSRAFGLLVVLSGLLVATEARADLVWRGQNLSELGIAKGAGLPTFYLYLDGAHSSFAGQGLSADTPVGTVFWGLYNQYSYSDSLRDDDGDEVDIPYRVSTYTLVQRIFWLPPLETEHLQAYVEVIPTLIATDFRVGTVSESTAGFADLGVGAGVLFADYHPADWLEVEGILGLDVFLPTGHYRPGGVQNLSFDTYAWLAEWDLILHFPKIGNGIYFSPSFYVAGASENDRFVNPANGEKTTYQFAPSVQSIDKLLYHLDAEHRFSTGLAGFFDFQWRDDRMSGSQIENSAERSAMLGPIFTATFGSTFFDFSVVREFAQRNRSEGTRVTFILYRVF